MPVFEFIAIHFDFQFLFKWPDTLRIDFSTCAAFFYHLHFLGMQNQFDENFMVMEDLVERSHFLVAMRMVRVPYWHENYFKLFEMGWDVLVMMWPRW